MMNNRYDYLKVGIEYMMDYSTTYGIDEDKWVGREENQGHLLSAECRWRMWQGKSQGHLPRADTTTTINPNIGECGERHVAEG